MTFFFFPKMKNQVASQFGGEFGAGLLAESSMNFAQNAEVLSVSSTSYLVYDIWSCW